VSRAGAGKLSRRLVLTLCAVGGGLWLTGLLRWALTAPEPTAPLPWWEPAYRHSLALHGGLAMAGLALLGLLYPLHFKAAWARLRHRLSGLLLLGGCLALAASGWALYYVGDEAWRLWALRAHAWIGLALPVFGLWHGLKARAPRP
jgi:hypothetical protein